MLALFLFKTVYYIYHLLAKTYCVALRYEYYAIECIGNDKYRSFVACEVQGLLYFSCYCAVDIGTKHHCFGQFLEFCTLKSVGILFVGKEEHNLLSPLVVVVYKLLYIVKRVVARLVSWVNQTKHIETATGGRKQRLFALGGQIVVFVFAIEVAYYLNVGLALTNYEFGFGGLAGFDVEEIQKLW